MDNQDIRTLKIFEKIERDQAPSQRDLAKELNISLGLVNSFTNLPLETSLILVAIIDEENIVGKNILGFETVNTQDN